MDKPKTNIEDYICGFPENIQTILQQIREVIRQAAPEASEAIKYAMPTFVYKGNLVHFAAYKKYIGFYPTPSGIDAFQNELAPYNKGKGTLHFPLEKPIPFDLIAKIVELRVKENSARAKSKKK